MDVRVPGAAEAAVLGDGSPAGREDDRGVGASGVDDGPHRVGGADGDVDHDDLGAPRDRVVAVGHRHRHVLVRNEEGLGRGPPLRLELGEAVDGVKTQFVVLPEFSRLVA